jgi:hypothetical protein
MSKWRELIKIPARIYRLTSSIAALRCRGTIERKEVAVDADDLVDDFGAGTSDVVDAVERVENAVTRVERTIKEKTSSITAIGWLLFSVGYG